jgi:cytochrome c oxidase subunit 1
MTELVPRPIETRPYPVRAAARGTSLLRFLHTTDPKDIGILYLPTSFGFFMVGGAMAMLMRVELDRPGTQFLSPEQYNQLFTMHGTIMLLLYATPILFGFANYILPLQIGSPDVAFPRLNAMSYSGPWPRSIPPSPLWHATASGTRPVLRIRTQPGDVCPPRTEGWGESDR